MTVSIRALSADQLHDVLPDMCRILIDSVAEGAAISFMHPLSMAEAQAFWIQSVLPDLKEGGRLVLVAEVGGRCVGTVQVLLAMPPNQPHRAEIAKMIVHPDTRRQGLARALMHAALDMAREAGKTLVTLDTRTGDAAEPLYAAVGFETAGVIPGFALDPDGQALHATTYMYRNL